MGDEPQLTFAEWARPEVLFAFVDELRDRGFNLGTSHYAAAQDLLLALVAEQGAGSGSGLLGRSEMGAVGGSGGQGGPGRLARLLGPLLCSSASEQEQFPQLLARWGAGPGRMLSAALAPDDGGDLAEGAVVGRLSAGRPGTESKAIVRRELRGLPMTLLLKRIERGEWLWLAVVSVVGVLLIAVGMTGYRVGGEPVEGVPLVVRTFWQGVPLGWLLAAAVAAVGGYLSWRLWLAVLGRQFLVRRAVAGAPDLEPLSVRASGEALFSSSVLRRSAEQLRRRVTRPGRELDPEATIERTARQGGWLVPVAGRQLVRPEYLLLIERAHPQDQRLRYFDELAERLIAKGVALERAYFDGDPRVCFRSPLGGVGTVGSLRMTAGEVGGASGQPFDVGGTSRPAGAETAASLAATPIGLRELYSLYPDHRLLLLTSGEGLFSPISGDEEPWVDQLTAWKERAVLVPPPTEPWGRRERQLARRFAMVPATLSGWNELAKAFEGRGASVAWPGPGDREAAGSGEAGVVAESARLPEDLRLRPGRWLARNPPEVSRVDGMLDELETSLGEAGFYWLAACAVYPALDWEITVSLGEMLEDREGKPLWSSRRLGALLELPWLRHGSMPQWLRSSLIARLSRQREAAVRAALEALLLTALEGRVARTDGGFALEVATRHRRALHRLWRMAWRRWTRRAADADVDSPVRDYVFRDFMAGRRPRLTVALPQRLARQLRRWRKARGAGEAVVEAPEARRARRLFRVLLILSPSGVLLSSFVVRLFGYRLLVFGVVLFVCGLHHALAALGFVWGRRNLLMTGVYWAVITPITLSLVYVGAQGRAGFIGALISVIWIGVYGGRQIEPLTAVAQAKRFNRFRLVFFCTGALDLAYALGSRFVPVFLYLAVGVSATVTLLLALYYVERRVAKSFAALAAIVTFTATSWVLIVSYRYLNYEIGTIGIVNQNLVILFVICGLQLGALFIAWRSLGRESDSGEVTLVSQWGSMAWHFFTTVRARLVVHRSFTVFIVCTFLGALAAPRAGRAPSPSVLFIFVDSLLTCLSLGLMSFIAILMNMSISSVVPRNGRVILIKSGLLGIAVAVAFSTNHLGVLYSIVVVSACIISFSMIDGRTRLRSRLRDGIFLGLVLFALGLDQRIRNGNLYASSFNNIALPLLFGFTVGFTAPALVERERELTKTD